MSLNKAANYLRKLYPMLYEDKDDARREILDDIINATGWFILCERDVISIEGRKFKLSPSDLDEIDRIDMQISLMNS